MKYTIHFKGEPSDYGHFETTNHAAERLLRDKGYWSKGDDLMDASDYLDTLQTSTRPVLQDWSIEEV